MNKKSDSDIVQVIVPKEENVYSNLFMLTMLKIADNSKGVRMHLMIKGKRVNMAELIFHEWAFDHLFTEGMVEPRRAKT